MRTSIQVVLKALLAKCPPVQRASLAKFLSPAERQSLDKLPKTYGDPLSDITADEDLLKDIHSSWISPFLRTLSAKDIGFFLASLPPAQAAAVGKDLLYSGKPIILSPAGKLYLQKTLLRYLTAEIDELLPLSCLPESPLNALLSLKNETLILSLDFLGLHDLAIEVRQIIEKQKLSKIHEALTSAQQNYLKILLQSPEPLSFSRMGIAQWNGDQEKLKALIRQRGANRLGKALHGQDPSLIWYLLHKLDVERALLVKKLNAPLDNPRAVQLLIGQVLEFITYTGQSHE